MRFGTNLSFGVKRWVEPESWTRVIRHELGLDLAQFSFDFVDPWWPAELRQPLARRIRKACADEGITLHSAFVGLAHYSYNQLCHPLAEGRAAARQWYRNAIDFAAELGVECIGGPAGAVSADDALDADKVEARYQELLTDLHALTSYAKTAGLTSLLIEPTPLTREFPWNISGAQRMQNDLAGQTAVPVQWCFDWGHAIYQPLYGKAEAKTLPWLQACKDHIGQIQLQQSDGQLDRHWSFASDGIVDPHEVVSEICAVGLSHLPIFLEVFYPFEWTNEQVLADMKTCIARTLPAFRN
jgi:sugar phosphate isomerase/epimerase